MPTETVTASVSPVELPPFGLRVSQVASSLTDQFKVPPPEFWMFRVWLDGLDPPCVALKLKLDGLDKFLKTMGIKKIEAVPKLSVKKKDILPEEAKIVVLQP